LRLQRRTGAAQATSVVKEWSMIVQVRCSFSPPTAEDRADMASMALDLTDDPSSVRVFEDEWKDWLVVEFTMRTQAQYKVVDRVYEACGCLRRVDWMMGFPKTEAEEARHQRKLQRARERRRERRAEREREK
jgi:hypothetical protein